MTIKRGGEGWSAWSIMAPALLLILVFIAAPFVLAIALSFTDQRLVPNPRLATRFVCLLNYERIVGDNGFLQAFKNTALFAVAVTPLQSGIALAMAMLVNARLPARNVLRGVYFLPTVVPMVVVSIAWACLFRLDGFFNQLLSFVTFGAAGPVDWLQNESTALPSIIALSAWQGFGFQMVIYLAGLQSINPELYEAARIEGAGRWGEFRHITMPGLRNTHIFVLVTTTIAAFKLFTQVHVLTQGGPRGSTNTVTRYLYEIGFSRGRVGQAAAVAVVFFIVVFAVSMAQRLLLKEDREGRS
ncbi:MAG: sugar ABC transporter permease [Planctomycetota bacterium]|jgi:multiple sugar transport system permease protein|nr:sugar ABC transporter permease [Planctomycetota bacterium]